MNQSELIEKVAQATELNQAAAGHAVKAVVNAILDALLAGDAVRVSGLGIFNIAARPAREGRNPKPERPSRSQPARRCGSTQARRSKMPSIRRLQRRLLDEVCAAKEIHDAEVNILDVRRAGTATSSLAISRDASSGMSRLAGAARSGQCCVHQNTAGQSLWRFLIGRDIQRDRRAADCMTGIDPAEESPGVIAPLSQLGHGPTTDLKSADAIDRDRTASRHLL